MLNDAELEALLEEHNVTDIGKRIVRAIRSSEPVRVVGGGAKNVAVRFASKKMKRTIQAESHTLELSVLWEWEYDHQIYEFYDQPSQLKIRFKNKNGKSITSLYTPDFFVIGKEKIGWVECKPTGKLKEIAVGKSTRYKNKGGKWISPPCIEYAEQYGLSFDVLSEENFNDIHVRNLIFLSDYYNAFNTDDLLKAFTSIKKLFASKKWITLLDLVDTHHVSPDVIYSLIANNFLYVDFDNELIADSRFLVVCVDLSAHYAYKAFSSSLEETPSKAPSVIRLEVGEIFLWKRQKWEVVSLTEKNIFVRTNGLLQELSVRQFESLIKASKIKSISNVSANSKERTRIMHAASPRDIELAMFRKKALQEFRESGLTSSPKRTIGYYKKLERESELIYGNKYTGLLGHSHKQGNYNRKISNNVIEAMHYIIENVYKNKYF